jgi:hypothetical protein
MRKIILNFSIITLLIFFASCDNKEIKKIEDTPDALQNDKYVFSGNRSANILELLYEDLKEKNPEIMKLEERLDLAQSRFDDVKKEFDKYDSKSNSYYQIAELKAKSISDSLLREKINGLILNSNKEYVTKKAKLDSLLKQLDQQNTNILDKHQALQILLTLPLIEKYQNDFLLGTKEFEELILSHDSLIDNINRLTPKY